MTVTPDTESTRTSPSSPGFGNFFDGRDMTFGIGAQALICAPAAVVFVVLWQRSGVGLVVSAVAAWLTMIAGSFAFLWLLRTLWPMKPGVYSYSPRDPTTYVWTLNSFICATNIGVFYNNPSLMPSVIKKLFYRLLGARLAPGHMMIGGRLTDPHLITIEKDAVIGGDSWLLAHAMSRFERNVLILKPIVIRRGAIIGAASLIMPGVTMEEDSILRAMSYVPMNTTIPSGSIWGGNPAAPRPVRNTSS